MSYSTYAEYLQTPQFRSVCRQVKVRSKGQCEGQVWTNDGPERCTKLAIDFHHVCYPKWGTYDTPENLLHLCRGCHTKAHTCDTCGGILKADAIKAGRKTCFECYLEMND